MAHYHGALKMEAGLHKGGVKMCSHPSQMVFIDAPQNNAFHSADSISLRKEENQERVAVWAANALSLPSRSPVWYCLLTLLGYQPGQSLPFNSDVVLPKERPAAFEALDFSIAPFTIDTEDDADETPHNTFAGPTRLPFGLRFKKVTKEVPIEPHFLPDKVMDGMTKDQAWFGRNKSHTAVAGTSNAEVSSSGVEAELGMAEAASGAGVSDARHSHEAWRRLDAFVEQEDISIPAVLSALRDVLGDQYEEGWWSRIIDTIMREDEQDERRATLQQLKAKYQVLPPAPQGAPVSVVSHANRRNLKNLKEQQERARLQVEEQAGMAEAADDLERELLGESRDGDVDTGRVILRTTKAGYDLLEGEKARAFERRKAKEMEEGKGRKQGRPAAEPPVNDDDEYVPPKSSKSKSKQNGAKTSRHPNDSIPAYVMREEEIETAFMELRTMEQLHQRYVHHFF